MQIPARLAEALSERYRIEPELGAGGMATVSLAHDIKHDRKVALKVLKPELAAVLGGARFLMLYVVSGRISSTGERVVLVQNFADELLQRVPR